MPYVKRDGSGNIIELRRWPETPDHEFLAADHPDVVAYKNKPRPTRPKTSLPPTNASTAGGLKTAHNALLTKLKAALPDVFE